MREIQDHWFREAKKEGYRSRAAFKLLQVLQKRPALMGRGSNVLDVGAAPGSWTQVAAKAVGPRGGVYSVDLNPISPQGLPDQVRLVTADALQIDPTEGQGPVFDVVLSDMAPATSGHPSTDHLRSVNLCNSLLDRLILWLRPGGNLVMKVFEGSEYPALLARGNAGFKRFKGFKPQASRAESVEMFLIGEGFVPDPDQAPPESVAPRRSRGWNPG
ncbi:MAG: 50S rRNA methyltransferase [Phycisphaerae bacterium]|nr:50S rRNA methyltransferase [Phycisphaerae bacterium]